MAGASTGFGALGVFLGLGGLIAGIFAIYYVFADWGKQNTTPWKSGGIMMASVVGFTLAVGVMAYGFFRPANLARSAISR